MRSLLYLLISGVIAGALLYLVPLVPYGKSGPILQEDAPLRAMRSAQALIGAVFRAENTPPFPAQKAEKASKADKNAAVIDGFFERGDIPTLTFAFKPEEWDYLNRDQRRYAECAVIEENGATYKNVAVKLKGSAGSFQAPGAKPGLTLNFDKFKGAARFHGMSKLHLNNGAQDATFLMELIAGEMCRKAGVPASRCTHALVKIQDRDLGLYVLKEAFTKEFLAKFFQDPSGDLYESPAVQDVSENAEKDRGDEANRENLKELIGACREPDEKKRWERLEAILDVDQFLRFLAMESLLSHWDGYNFNRNNYRFYFDATTKKAWFFCHGMDQTFGDPNLPAIANSNAMVGQAILSNPRWKARRDEIVREIFETALQPVDWGARVSEIGARVKNALERKNPQWAKDYEGQIQNARTRVSQRLAAVAKQLEAMPRPVKFDSAGRVKIEGANWRAEGAAAALDEAQMDGRETLHIRAEGETAGSWRKTFALPAGKYRFEVQARTAAVQPSESSSGLGAGVRISGATRIGQNAAQGDSPWQTLAFQFEAPGGDVVLVAELRAQKGEVWFDKKSFQIVRVP